MILMIFGTAVDCQVTLSTNPAITSSEKGSFLSICMGWGAGAAFGIWASAGISGGHINPAVTLVHVIFRRLAFRQFVSYCVAQVAGAFAGALIVYGTYWEAISVYEGGHGLRTIPGTAGLFVTFPLSYTGPAILLIVVLAVTDKRNNAPPPELVPLIIFVAVTALSACLSLQTGAAMNPARDFGPRLMTAIFYGRGVFTYRRQVLSTDCVCPKLSKLGISHFWLWAPILGDFAGAIAGAAVYDVCIYTGEDSRVNTRSCVRPRRCDSRSEDIEVGSKA
ncbi:hypothetical protein FRB99_008673 [Tulasnella sp. 403]|nr:hypothetical protein FRB99_008673 [Tulasnella sp. 403]